MPARWLCCALLILAFPGLEPARATLSSAQNEDPHSGDAGNLEQSLSSIPAEQRLEAVLNAVNALEEGECSRKVSLLQLLEKEDEDGLIRKLSVLRDCQTYGPAREIYFKALSEAPAENLVNVLWSWFVPMNGIYPDDHGLGPKIAAALEERLKRQRDQEGVWEALSKAYEVAGLYERRAAHLVAWLESGLHPPDPGHLSWLGEFYAGQDAPQGGINALRQAWRKTHRIETASVLAELLLFTGKREDYAAFTAELAATQPTAAGKEPPEADLARLLRARATLVYQSYEAALPQFEAWADRVENIQLDEAEEYLLVVANARGEAAAENAIRSICSRKLLPTGSTPSECAASLLRWLGESKG